MVRSFVQVIRNGVLEDPDVDKVNIRGGDDNDNVTFVEDDQREQEGEEEEEDPLVAYVVNSLGKSGFITSALQPDEAAFYSRSFLLLLSLQYCSRHRRGYRQ